MAAKRITLQTPVGDLIPEGDTCACQFNAEVVDSFNYEESHNHCTLKNRAINKYTPLDQSKIKRPWWCPKKRAEKG